MDAKILIKILLCQIQAYIKKITHHDHGDFIIPEIRWWFNICKSIYIINQVNGLKEIKKKERKKNIMNTAAIEKAWQDPTCLLDKIPRESRTGGNIPQNNKGYIWQVHSQHHLRWKKKRENVEAILLNSGQNRAVHYLHSLST